MWSDIWSDICQNIITYRMWCGVVWCGVVCVVAWCGVWCGVGPVQCDMMGPHIKFHQNPTRMKVCFSLMCLAHSFGEIWYWFCGILFIIDLTLFIYYSHTIHQYSTNQMYSSFKRATSDQNTYNYNIKLDWTLNKLLNISP